MKHKHSEVIKAFADGIECEYWSIHGGRWVQFFDIAVFSCDVNVRVKPKPKPDVIGYAKVCSNYNFVAYISLASPQLDNDDNLKLIWDGETGKLKSAEVI